MPVRSAVVMSPQPGPSRMAVAVELVRPLIRAIDWVPVAVTALFTLVLVTFVSPGRDLDALGALLVLRASALLSGAAAAFAVVDAMAPSSGALPVPRWLRQWLRTLMAVAAVAAIWSAAYTIAVARLAPDARLPLADTALEAAVCVTAGLAAAALAVRRVTGRPAALAGSALLGALLVGSMFVAGDLSPWTPLPGDETWAAVHRGWLAALPVPLLVLLLAHRDLRNASRDRRARTPLRRGVVQS